MSGGTTFRSLTGGRDHTCGLASGGGTYGTVLCWGSNAFGQSGTGAVGGNVNTPTAIAGGMQFRQIEAGRQAICGVAMDAASGRDRPFCWGDASWAQAGNGTSGRGTGPRYGSPRAWPCSSSPVFEPGVLSDRYTPRPEGSHATTPNRG